MAAAQSTAATVGGYRHDDIAVASVLAFRIFADPISFQSFSVPLLLGVRATSRTSGRGHIHIEIGIGVQAPRRGHHPWSTTAPTGSLWGVIEAGPS
jgi:hypothetical protein